MRQIYETDMRADHTHLEETRDMQGYHLPREAELKIFHEAQ